MEKSLIFTFYPNLWCTRRRDTCAKTKYYIGLLGKINKLLYLTRYECEWVREEEHDDLFTRTHIKTLNDIINETTIVFVKRQRNYDFFSVNFPGCDNNEFSMKLIRLRTKMSEKNIISLTFHQERDYTLGLIC